MPGVTVRVNFSHAIIRVSMIINKTLLKVENLGECSGVLYTNQSILYCSTARWLELGGRGVVLV